MVAGTLDAFEAIADRLRDCLSLGLSRQPGQFGRQGFYFLAWNVECHPIRQGLGKTYRKILRNAAFARSMTVANRSRNCGDMRIRRDRPSFGLSCSSR